MRRGGPRAGRRASAVAIGSVVAGRYKIEDKLGEGGMAEVFRAEDQREGRRVAIKILHPDVATNPEAVERTKREGQVLSDLHNPAIVNVESYGELESGSVFLVMELLEGETLGARMRRGPLDPSELAPIVAGTCAGLHAAHTFGIVHRDLKPDNIFLCPTEHGLQVKLLDFGISKVYGEQKLTQTGEVLGTPRYMSPEQLGAEADVDVRVDVYALGVILYEALAGKPPFLAATPTDLIIAILNGKVVPLKGARPDVPPAVEAVVMRAMSKVRDARYDTAMALAEAYIDAVGGAAAVRGQQRRGMATVAMGGMKATAPPGAPDPVAGKLPIGTFSGLADAPPPGKGTQQMGASPGGAIPDAPPARAIPRTSSPEDPDSQPRAMPHTRATPMGIPDAPTAGAAASPPRESRPIAATAMMDSTSMSMSAAAPAPSMPIAPSLPSPEPRPRPKRSSGVARVLLVVGALIAGAASAGGVIFVLRSLESAPDDASDSEDAPAATPDAGAEPPGVDAGAALHPVGLDLPDGGVEAPVEVASAEPERRRRRRRSRSEPDTQRADPPDDPDDPDDTQTLPGFGSDALSRARAAQRAGHPDECIQILNRAIQNGASAIALRRRADCYEAAGQRDNAIRDYQRFCRLVPDHPSITEVRPLLESWGRTCP